jgi:branched-chain amino acid transport system permease protein
MAFSLVYLPTRIFHVALGAIFTAVPFFVWQLLRYNWPAPLAVCFGLGAGLGLSMLSDIFNHSPLQRKGASPVVHFVASLGAYLVTIQSVILIWGNDSKILRVGIDAVVKIGSIVITRSQIVAAGVAVLTVGILLSWIRFSKLGLQFRALADNPTELALRGYNLKRLKLLAFGVSGLIGSISSLLISLDLGFSARGGLNALVIAVVSVIIGGRRSYIGPLLGALLLTVVRSEVVWFTSAKWEIPVTFAILALALFLRPNGFLSRNVRLEAQL